MVRPKHADRMNAPCKPFTLTQGWTTIRVPVHQPDGRRLDADEARELHADKPYASILEYRGFARGTMVFQYDPEKLARLQAKAAAGTAP